MATVLYGIGGGGDGEQDRRVDAFPLQISPRPIGRRRVLGGVVIAVIVVASIWLVVAAGLQRDQTGGTRPGPLPGATSTIQVELPMSGIEAEAVPLPGPEITPVMGGQAPR